MTKYYQLTIITKEENEIVSEVSQFYKDKEEAIKQQEQVLDGFKYEPDDYGGYCFIDEISFNKLKDLATVSQYEALFGIEIHEPIVQYEERSHPLADDDS